MNAWSARHTPGAGGKASLELLKALARDGDRVDLADAHAEILRQAPRGSPGTDYAADNPPPAAHRVRSARSNPTVSSGRSGRPAESVRNGRGCRRITQGPADIRARAVLDDEPAVNALRQSQSSSDSLDSDPSGYHEFDAEVADRAANQG
jgi:hypothetical protein